MRPKLLGMENHATAGRGGGEGRFDARSAQTDRRRPRVGMTQLFAYVDAVRSTSPIESQDPQQESQEGQTFVFRLFRQICG